MSRLSKNFKNEITELKTEDLYIAIITENTYDDLKKLIESGTEWSDREKDLFPDFARVYKKLSAKNRQIYFNNKLVPRENFEM